MLGRGLHAPHRFLYPLEPHATLERCKLTWLVQQMLTARVQHMVLAVSKTQIELLEVSYYPLELWLDGCVPVLLEPFEIADFLGMGNAQVELVQRIFGVLEVRVLEATQLSFSL